MPRAVTVVPPSLEIEPPDLQELDVTEVTTTVETVGKTAGNVETILEVVASDFEQLHKKKAGISKEMNSLFMMSKFLLHILIRCQI